MFFGCALIPPKTGKKVNYKFQQALGDFTADNGYEYENVTINVLIKVS